MNRFGKRLGLLVGGVIVLSLAGQAGLAGLFAMVGLLVVVLFLAVGGSRPGSSGADGRRPRRARSISFLARYRPVDELEGLPGIVIAALAAWSTLELFEEASVLSVLTVGLLLPVICYVVWPNAAASVLGVLGAIAATATVFTRIGCGEPVSDQGRTVYALVIVVSVVIFIVIRSRLLPLPRPLGRSSSLGAAALIVFGLLETAAFVVNPNGLDVFFDAPGWAAPVALGLIVAIAVYASYAPTFVLALLALATALAQLALAATEVGALGSATTACGDPMVGLIYAAAFALVAAIGISFKPGRQAWWPR